jgi:hypothetical protein
MRNIIIRIYNINILTIRGFTAYDKLRTKDVDDCCDEIYRNEAMVRDDESYEDAEAER